MQVTPDVDPRLLFHAILYPKTLVVKKNNRPIFRNQKTGRSFIGKSQALVESERDLLLQLQSARNELRVFEPIKCRVFLRILFYMEQITNANGSFNKRQQDLDNLLAGPLDALQAASIIQNDNLIMSVFAEKVPAKETRIAIWIMEHDQSFSLKDYGP